MMNNADGFECMTQYRHFSAVKYSNTVIAGNGNKDGSGNRDVEKNGNGNDYTGMGKNGNNNSHSSTPLMIADCDRNSTSHIEMPREQPLEKL